MNSAKRACTNAQHAPSGAQARRLIPSQVARATAQRRNGGRVNQNSASVARLNTAFPRLPNNARAGRQSPVPKVAAGAPPARSAPGTFPSAGRLPGMIPPAASPAHPSQRPCCISRRFHRSIAKEVARFTDWNTPISSVITSAARPDWFSTVRPKIRSTSG